MPLQGRGTQGCRRWTCPGLCLAAWSQVLDQCPQGGPSTPWHPADCPRCFARDWALRGSGCTRSGFCFCREHWCCGAAREGQGIQHWSSRSKGGAAAILLPASRSLPSIPGSTGRAVHGAEQGVRAIFDKYPPRTLGEEDALAGGVRPFPSQRWRGRLSFPALLCRGHLQPASS